jgi:hypothetical protein
LEDAGCVDVVPLRLLLENLSKNGAIDGGKRTKVEATRTPSLAAEERAILY